MVIVAAILALQVAASQDAALALAAGDITARREALAGISATSPADRSDQMWRALRQEVDRLMVCLDVHPPSAAESELLRCDIRPTSEDNYLPDLIAALGQSSDPLMIPTLIRVAPSGGMAAAALARFGDVAVPALIESALGSRSGPWGDESSGAMFTLARMLEQPAPDSGRPLSSGSRRQINDAARTVFQSKLTWVNQIGIVMLALATADADLRSRVETLATDRSEWRRMGVTDEARIIQVQNSIRAQLVRHPKK